MFGTSSIATADSSSIFTSSIATDSFSVTSDEQSSAMSSYSSSAADDDELVMPPPQDNDNLEGYYADPSVQPLKLLKDVDMPNPPRLPPLLSNLDPPSLLRGSSSFSSLSDPAADENFFPDDLLPIEKAENSLSMLRSMKKVEDWPQILRPWFGKETVELTSFFKQMKTNMKDSIREAYEEYIIGRASVYELRKYPNSALLVQNRKELIQAVVTGYASSLAGTIQVLGQLVFAPMAYHHEWISNAKSKFERKYTNLSLGKIQLQGGGRSSFVGYARKIIRQPVTDSVNRAIDKLHHVQIFLSKVKGKRFLSVEKYDIPSLFRGSPETVSLYVGFKDTTHQSPKDVILSSTHQSPNDVIFLNTIQTAKDSGMERNEFFYRLSKIWQENMAEVNASPMVRRL